MNEEVIRKVSDKINLKDYQIKNVISMLSEGELFLLWLVIEKK